MAAAQINGQYCAGLWWEDISYSICWHTNRYSPFESFRPDCYIAPSWSWASVMGRVDFPSTISSFGYTRPKSLDSVTFHDYQSILRGSNPYGEIECAWLELEAPLAPLSKATVQHKMDSPAANRPQYFSIVDRVSGELLGAVFDDVNDKPVSNLFALFMMHTGDLGSDGDNVWLSGLILRPAVEQERIRDKYEVPKGLGFYQRVGWFSLNTRQAKEVLEVAHVTKMVLL